MVGQERNRELWCGSQFLRSPLEYRITLRLILGKYVRAKENFFDLGSFESESFGTGSVGLRHPLSI
jgi:hypothetical protein